MQYETSLGLRRAHSFDQVRQYVQRDPDKISYPKRTSTFLQASHIYGQVEAGMRHYGQDAQREQADYQAGDEQAPYVPPRPKPPQPKPPQPRPPEDPDETMPQGDDLDEQIAGPRAPPAPPPAPQIQAPANTALGLQAEGVRTAPPPPPPQLINYQPNNPPPPPRIW